jgi:hypothetical protein
MYPNKAPSGWISHVPRFHGENHLAIQHIASFMDYASEINIDHEDVIMKLFYHSLIGDARNWFGLLGKEQYLHLQV